MILVDTSVWVDHLRSGDTALMALLEGGEVLSHPAVIGELALGYIGREETVIESLSKLPAADVATDDDVLVLIRHYSLAGSGIGYTDAQILTSARLTRNARLWTRDRRLRAVAKRLALEADIEP